LTGIPVSVIETEYVRQLGTTVGPFARWMLRGRRTKGPMRTWFALNAARKMKASLNHGTGSREYWQAGRSVAGIHDIRPAGEIVREFAGALAR
ncbi:MAG: nitronate monooxygenase, partial [Gemmatimonadetes bacterium]|nr:nitronate monooxygenase [Gemmatimonadota bacterium]